MLQQRLLREPIQIVAIWKAVVSGCLIVEWTYPNGTSPHTWGTNLRNITLHIPHISMSYILCDREMWVFVEFTTVHMQ